MQTKEELEEFYQTPDPWKYQGNEEDLKRIAEIATVALGVNKGKPYKKVLDIGAGEGYVTQYLPAKEKHGFELSDTAASRFPSSVKRVELPRKGYDLVVLAGVLYEQYDWRGMIDLAKRVGNRVIVTCNIKENERPEVLELGEQVLYKEFPYHHFTEVLRVFIV